jgi:hypothetical protein
LLVRLRGRGWRGGVGLGRVRLRGWFEVGVVDMYLIIREKRRDGRGDQESELVERPGAAKLCMDVSVYGYKPASWHRRISLGLDLDYMAI